MAAFIGLAQRRWDHFGSNHRSSLLAGDIRVFEICTAEALLLPHFLRLGDWPDVNAFLNDRRVKIDGRDARFVLMTEDRQYDLIEADAIRSNGAFAGYL